MNAISQLVKRVGAKLQPAPAVPGWVGLLAAYGVHGSAGELGEDGKVLLRHIGVAFDPNRPPEPLLRAHDFAVQLRERASARFSLEPDGRVRCDIAGVRHRVGTAEEVFILREIYLCGEYDLALGGSLVFVDAGANVGFSALFFAAAHPDAEVEAFEPVPQTYRRGVANVGLNDGLAPRIHFHNRGLFSSDTPARIVSNLDRPGRSSLLLGCRDGRDRTEEVEVALRDASAEMREILLRWPGRRVVLKLDTEGAEYAILENLAASGLLGRIDVVLGEWHRVDDARGPARLAEILLAAGFATVLAGHRDPAQDAGMFYAFRSAQRYPADGQSTRP